MDTKIIKLLNHILFFFSLKKTKCQNFHKNLINGLNPKLAAQFSNMMQKYVIENTRLGIPIFLAEEAPHGHMAIGTTVFPTGQGLAATFSRFLMEKAGQIISKEIRLQGAHVSYGPVMDLTRDPR